MPVTLYAWFVVGDAITVEPVDVLREIFGDQV
jgi:hypothetical protein